MLIILNVIISGIQRYAHDNFRKYIKPLKYHKYLFSWNALQECISIMFCWKLHAVMRQDIICSDYWFPLLIYWQHFLVNLFIFLISSMYFLKGLLRNICAILKASSDCHFGTLPLGSSEPTSWNHGFSTELVGTVIIQQSWVFALILLRHSKRGAYLRCLIYASIVE